ncbi:MAG: peptidoglycan-binding protein, partial [Mesorhizobium sp.]
MPARTARAALADAGTPMGTAPEAESVPALITPTAPTDPAANVTASTPAGPTVADAEPMAPAPAATPATQEMTGTVTPADASTAAATAKIDIPTDAGPAALRDAAAGGDAKALFEIGSRYAESRGVKQDMAAAAK